VPQSAIKESTDAAVPSASPCRSAVRILHQAAERTVTARIVAPLSTRTVDTPIQQPAVPDSILRQIELEDINSATVRTVTLSGVVTERRILRRKFPLRR
jgi:hypothetical protein